MPKSNKELEMLAGLPKASFSFIEPMLAKLVAHLPQGDTWLYEIKLDGYRALAVNRRGKFTLYSRRGNKLNQRFRIIAEAFSFLPKDTIVDGEVVALDDRGRPSFGALQNSLTRAAPLYFYAFDLLTLRGKDVRKLPLITRRRLLEDEALKEMQEPVRVSAVFNGNAKRLVAAVRKQGLEGIVAKRVDSLYEAGERSGSWLKYKTNKGQELVIGGYKPSPSGFEYLLAGYYEGRDLLFVGKIKNGFNPALRRKVAERFASLETDACPFANLPEPANARRGEALTAEVMKQMRWLKPKLVAQIEFTEWTRSNHLRHSKFVALRDDKKPQQVRHEMTT